MGNGKPSKEVPSKDVNELQNRSKECQGNDHRTFNVAVIGESGSGKSCFINAFRNVKRGDKSFAGEDVIETTSEPTPYEHPDYPHLIIWDLPGVGVGTKAFPKEKYKDVMKFTKYDFFLILSSQRFTENDKWLTETINTAGKRFVFVRTQIDLDIIKRNDLHQTEVIEKVRMDCLKKLPMDDKTDTKDLLFLINSKSIQEYDFEKLNTSIIQKMNMDQETISKEHEEALKMAFKKGGLRQVKHYLDSEKDKWKDTPLHIAVTGNSGVGKSCFINTIRNVKSGENLFAKEDVIETTKKPTPYHHPEYPNLVLWDLPGVGTEAFPRERYLKQVDFIKYDFFMILSSQRFTENDHWLANEVTKGGKRFFFVRTQIDVDVIKRNDLKESEVVEKVRNDCVNKLKADGLICDVEEALFLINNKEHHAFDFDKLATKLIEIFPTVKREALVLSLTIMTEGVIKAKKAVLQKKVFLYAIASAVAGAVPIPGIGASVDIMVLVGAAIEYMKQFGLDDITMEKHARDLGMTVDSLKKKLNFKSLHVIASIKGVTAFCTSFAISAGVENAAKFVIPIIGSIIASGVSYGVCDGCLTGLLNDISDVALLLNREKVRMFSSSITVAEAFEEKSTHDSEIDSVRKISDSVDK